MCDQPEKGVELPVGLEKLHDGIEIILSIQQLTVRLTSLPRVSAANFTRR